MREAKIKSFIQFIGKLGSNSRQPGEIPLENTTNNISEQWQKIHYNTIGMSDNTKPHAIILRKTNQCIVDKCSIELTTHQDNHIKHRYEDKKMLYEAYRNSLKKKQEQLQIANSKLLNKSNKISQRQSLEKQLVLGSNKSRVKKIKSGYQKQKILSNRSISINPTQSYRRLKTQKLTDRRLKAEKLIQSQKAQIFAKHEQEYLRQKKLNYKPIFRVKKIHLLDSYRTETAPPPQKQQLPQIISIKQQKSEANRIKIKTQPIQEYSKNISFRGKNSNKGNGFEKGWEYDQYEQIQKIFF